MNNKGLISVMLAGTGLLLIWAGWTGRNPVRVLKDVLTTGKYDKKTEYK